MSTENSQDEEILAPVALKELKLVEVLQKQPAHKSAFVHAKSSTEQDAVIIIEKKPIEESLIDALLSDKSDLKVDVKNDIYHCCSVNVPKDLNALRATLIYPATPLHIEKYREQEVQFIVESPQDYETITKPYAAEQAPALKWVYNVLSHEAESHRIIFEDPDPQVGFILAIDIKWDGKSTEGLYLTALVHRRDIKCIRDLRAEHLGLLKNIRDKGKAAIAQKYGVKPCHLRCYFHYQPSYYHLHVHFTIAKNEVPGQNAGKAHLLDDVISCLEQFPDYFRAVHLSFYLATGHELYKRFVAAGKVEI